MNNPLQIASNFVVMNTHLDAKSLAVTENFYAELDEMYGNFASQTLISCRRFDGDWQTWEKRRKILNSLPVSKPES